MASGTELNQSLTADAVTYTLTIEGRQTGGQTPEIIASYVTSKKVAVLTAARVTGVSALTAAGSITGLTTYDMGNSIHVLLSARFSVAAASATFALALYDAAGTLMGITRSYTLQGDASYYDAGSKYPAPVEIVDIAAASKVGIVLRSLSSGTVDVYIEAL